MNANAAAYCRKARLGQNSFPINRWLYVFWLSARNKGFPGKKDGVKLQCLKVWQGGTCGVAVQFIRVRLVAGMSTNIEIFEYFVPRINICIWIITFFILDYIRIFALWSKYICKYCNLNFVPFLPKCNLLSAYFPKKYFALNIFEYLLKL